MTQMVNHGTVRSTVKPNTLVIDESSVWVHTNITEVNGNVGQENEFTGFEFDCVQYDKNEYIKLMSEKNDSLEQQLTDAQLALVELYEGMVV
jgi:hypothetical protein